MAELVETHPDGSVTCRVVYDGEPIEVTIPADEWHGKKVAQIRKRVALCVEAYNRQKAQEDSEMAKAGGQ